MLLGYVFKDIDLGNLIAPSDFEMLDLLIPEKPICVLRADSQHFTEIGDCDDIRIICKDLSVHGFLW